MATCHLCGDHLPDSDMGDHLRIMHPDEWGDGPERWPDGAPVIVDMTLEPGDFRTLSVQPHPPDPANTEAFWYWHCSRCGPNDHEHPDWEAAMDAAEQHVCEL